MRDEKYQLLRNGSMISRTDQRMSTGVLAAELMFCTVHERRS